MFSSALPAHSAHSYTPVFVYGVITAGRPGVGASPFTRAERIYIPPQLRRGGLAAYRVSGHSMDDGTPESIDEDEYVLVDTHDISTSYGRVYAVRTASGDVIVKRLQLHKGRRALISDNKTIKPITDLQDYEILGRVYAVYEGPDQFRFIR